MSAQRTFSIIKPDATRRNLTGAINAKLEEVASSSGLDLEQVKGFYGNDNNMKNNLMYAIREEKTFEKMYEIVKLS